MGKIATIFILMSFLVPVLSCNKDDDKDNNPPVSQPCELTGGYVLKATVNNSLWCADVSLFGDLAILMTINGMKQDGSSLTLELDDFIPGTYEISADRNHILYTTAGSGYESTNDNPGILTIIENNESSNYFRATFSGVLKNPIGGSINISGGEVKLIYTE